MSASRSVTSSCSGRSLSPKRSPRSSRVEVSRAVAATVSPRSSAAMAHSRPKPRDAPVMNQVLDMLRAARDPRGLFPEASDGDSGDGGQRLRRTGTAEVPPLAVVDAESEQGRGLRGGLHALGHDL